MNSEINEVKKDILYWMNDYIADHDDPPYTKEDVSEFDSIITDFVTRVGGSSEKEKLNWITNEVRKLVLSLNTLNEKHDSSIIETGEREGICLLIKKVIESSGHNLNQDITEEWREW